MRELSAIIAAFNIKIEHIKYDACKKLDELKDELIKSVDKAEAEVIYQSLQAERTPSLMVAMLQQNASYIASDQRQADPMINSHNIFRPRPGDIFGQHPLHPSGIQPHFSIVI